MPRNSHLRAHGDHADHSVSPLELFFDLVFVFAVTQLSHYLLAHHSLIGALQTLVMFLAVWWAWIYTAWATNWLDPNRAPVRLILLVVMLLSMVLSSAIPLAFGPAGLVFALAYAGIQVGRTLYTAWAREGIGRGNSTNMLRATFYFMASAVLWIAGGLDADPGRRLLWWLAALAIEYAGPFTMFHVPGMGRSSPDEWRISGAHMAERAGLFIIIALGEGIIVTGATFAELQPAGPAILAFLSAFVGSVAMWWIYFDVGARRGVELIEHDDRPGLIGRQAYTYGHIPIVAGIILLAVADEQALVHPEGHLEPYYVAALIGGALAFIGGAGLFKRMTSPIQRWPLSHVTGLGLFALLGAWGWLAHPQPLHLHLAATGLFLLIALWEWGSYHGGWRERFARLRGRSG
ncbi:MAG TPA: low temperature requirement protein A [Sphingomicrobium sp.]|jgi:low temperature requirement protein LtrA|nr:low temperature requirement protein A [Sphingomicrobium sp.]